MEGIVTVNNLIVNEICFMCFDKYPSKVKQFEMGYGNYVFKINIGYDKFVLRLNSEKNAYKDTIYWIEELSRLELPVPKVINKGIYSEFSYLILNYIEGDDLGNVYVELSTEEKREIAKKIVNIQNAVSKHLDRSQNRIRENKDQKDENR